MYLANILVAELDGDQPVVFHYIDPCFAMERHAGKAKFKSKFYFQHEPEDSWTGPGVRAFGRVNGGTAFQGFQILAGNAIQCVTSFLQTRQDQQKTLTTILYMV
jgi:hypothetical protein